MLMSAPPGLGWPGYTARLSDHSKDMRLNRTHHTSGRKWLNKTFSLSWSGYQDGSHAHEDWSQQGGLADWNIDCRVSFGMCVWNAIVVKNGQMDEANVFSARGQRTDPFSTLNQAVIVSGKSNDSQ